MNADSRLRFTSSDVVELPFAQPAKTPPAAPDLEALALKVEKAELQVRLLEATLRITRGKAEIAALKAR